jgi:hypothetical protein
MTVSTVTMFDTINQSAGNIPQSAKKVGGYVTGPENILWPPVKWALFPNAGHVSIDQSADLTMYGAGSAEVADVEAGAGTYANAAEETQNRQTAKASPGTLYVSAANVDDLVAELHKSEVDFSDVYLWLANWDLDEAEATALVGTEVQGLRVVAVQWASPSSNPHTQVPGESGQTLLGSNLDLSVAEAGWIPAPGYVAPVAPEPTPEPVPEEVPVFPGTVVNAQLLGTADHTTDDLQVYSVSDGSLYVTRHYATTNAWGKPTKIS